MTALINGLAHRSALRRKNVLDVVTKLDGHGGLEFGTWDYPAYIGSLNQLLGRSLRDESWYKGMRKVSAGRFVYRYKTVQERERALIYERLNRSRYQRTLQHRGRLYRVTCFRGTSLCLRPKWADRLIRLFADPRDPPAIVMA